MKMTVQETIVVEQALLEFAEKAYNDCEKYNREDPAEFAAKSYKYDYKTAVNVLAKFFTIDLRADYNV